MAIFARRPRRALTAAAERSTPEKAESIRRLRQNWQQRALAYYDLLGEVNYAAQFYSRMLTPLRLYAGRRVLSDDGLVEIEPTDEPAVVEQLDRIQDPGGGGRSNLLGSYGRLMFLTGEGYLFCSNDADGEEQWEMLSTDEIRVDGRRIYRRRAPQLNPETYDQIPSDQFDPVAEAEAVAYRIWKRHPKHSALADSTMRGVLDVAEELVLLTQVVRSRARSRMAGSGVLFIDEAVSPPPPEPGPDDDPMEDPFVARFVEAIVSPIADEGSASAVAPLITRVPVPEGKTLAELFYHLKVVDPMEVYPETGLRRELIERLAIGLDMPPEVLTGIADANHWTGWMIDEQTWKAHGQPVAQQLVDDLTAAFFRPTLKELGIADWQSYVIDYDAAAIVNQPNRAKDAKDVHDRGAIGDAALREAAGFGDQDAPTEEDRRIWLSVNSRDPTFAMTGEVTPPPAPPTAPVPPDGGTVDGGSAPDEAPLAPPEQNQAQDGQLAARVLGAADVALVRARDAAGSRVRSLARKDKQLAEEIQKTPAGEVCAAVGRERARQIGAPPDRALVQGACDPLVSVLAEWGLDGSGRRVADLVEEHAARTLFERRPRPLPPSFRNYVLGVTTRVPVG